MMRFTVAAGVVLMGAALAPGAEVWHATFDTGMDGVTQFWDWGVLDMLPEEPPVGGTLKVDIMQLYGRPGLHDFVKAGRALEAGGTFKDLTTSHSAYYKFRWTALYEGDFGSVGDPPYLDGAYSYAGFVTSASYWPLQGDLNVLMVNYKDADTGEYMMRLYASCYGTGSAETGAPEGWVSLGTDPFSQDHQLVIAYDHTTSTQTVALFDASGNQITGVSQNVSGVSAQFDYLGWQVAPNLLGGTQDIMAQSWACDDLMYFNDAQGAFGAVIPEPSSLLLLLGAMTAVVGRRR